MGINYNPRTVTDGLVLALDAGSPKNYNLTAVEVLVVAGGGAGAQGGGGAGGVIYNSNFAVTPGSALTVTVGGGGTTTTQANAANGGNSIFGTLTAIGGGRGASFPSDNASTGGSGGGGSADITSAVRRAGTSGQGFSGGISTRAGYGGGGGGGGAGGAGKDSNQTQSNSGNGGDGGIGLQFPQFSTIGGSPSGWFGGGGAGGGNTNGETGLIQGLGGFGGGGNGTTVDSQNGFDAVNNTGGGGGGCDCEATKGGNGGSGIVIVRYQGPQKAIGGTITSNNGYTIHTFTTVESTTFTPLVATNNSAILGLSDFSGNNNFGTAVNGPTYSTSNSGSLSFDGVDDRVECGTFSLSYLTISTWVYKTSSATNQGICRKQNGWAVSQYNGTLQVAPGTSWAFYDTGYTIPLNTWVNIVYTYSGTGTTGSQTVYVNGSNIYSSSAGSGAISANSNAVRVGFDDNNWFWGGRISNTQIYNRALTAAEIQQNFNALRGRFSI